jgi:molybdopterin-guanine dinucleotide biosynthesis protein B
MTVPKSNRRLTLSPLPILSVVGYSGTGKTTLIERLLPCLGVSGLAVGTAKHHHRALELDQPGKDSYRHAVAGSQAVALVSQGRFAVLKPAPDTPRLGDLAAHYFNHLDLLLAEGFSGQGYPKIEVLAKDATPRFAGRADLVAVVTPGHLPEGAAAWIHRDDVPRIAKIITTWRADWIARTEVEVELGDDVELTPALIAQLRGMIQLMPGRRRLVLGETSSDRSCTDND